MGLAEASKHTPKSMEEIMGCCETLNIFNANQYEDFSRHVIAPIYGEDKSHIAMVISRSISNTPSGSDAGMRSRCDRWPLARVVENTNTRIGIGLLS